MRKIEDLDELKALELGIMKKLHTFCMEHGITYYLAYGTLLGAVRHNGFIPWDDDIDIQIPREDYNRFLTEFQKVQDNYRLKVVNARTKPYFGRNFSKVIDLDTIVVEPKYKDNDEIGVFVDIWPMDGTPKWSPWRKAVILYAKLLSKIQLASSTDFRQEESILRKLAVIFCNVFSSKRLVEVIDRIATRYKVSDSDYVNVYCGVEGEFDKRAYNEGILHSFEDVEFNIPAGYDYILKKCYGDYMRLPPEAQQKPHHIMNTFYK